ncbi:MAG TPA: hypothetical protein VG347_00875 [Verrucomicrobiae bacterium]|nr:hypothetical protein [Verrucomicrobiae bacterium]
MNKEIRAEIRLLKRAARKVRNDERVHKQRIALVMKGHKIAFHKARKESAATSIRADRACEKIDRRLAILKGRLA